MTASGSHCIFGIVPRDPPVGHAAILFKKCFYFGAATQYSVVWLVAPPLKRKTSHTFGFNNFNQILRKNPTSQSKCKIQFFRV